MRDAYIGIDNGVTGTIAIIHKDGRVDWTKTPVKRELAQTKKAQYVSRIDVGKLEDWFKCNLYRKYNWETGLFVALERPAIDPDPYRIKTTVSAARSFEATLIVLEKLGLPYQVFDSRAWQREMLPEGCKGAALKTAACQVARRLFPNLGDNHDAYKDADGLLLAEWARRKGL